MTSSLPPRALVGAEAADALVDALPEDTFAQVCGRGRLVVEARLLAGAGLGGAALWRGNPWGSNWSGGGEPAALARLTEDVQPESLSVPASVGLPPGLERGWGWGWHAALRPPDRQPGEESVGWLGDDDDAELRALVAHAFPDAETPPDDPRIARWFGARRDGRLVAAAAELRTAPEAALLSSLTVDPAVRREGWGSAVTAWFARIRLDGSGHGGGQDGSGPDGIGHDGGARVVGLGTYLGNARARALYARLGFLEVDYVGGSRAVCAGGRQRNRVS